MYTTTGIDKDKPLKPTEFLNRRVLCGLCKFKCCNSPSLYVECTEEEQSRLDLPVTFSQDGHCRCLTEEGCVHKEGRPVFCKLFPLQVKKSSVGYSLIVSHWSVLNCPTANDYVYTGHDDRGHVYERKPVSGAKRNNSEQTLVLGQPIEELPLALEGSKEALESIYYVGVVDKLRRILNGDNKLVGFGFQK